MVIMKTSVADLKARLSEYLERVERGERIVVCRHNKPVAELGPVETSRTEPRPLGPVAGRPAFEVGSAFSEPLSAAELDAWEGGNLPLRDTAYAGHARRASRVAETGEAYEAGTAARPKGRRRRS